MEFGGDFLVMQSCLFSHTMYLSPILDAYGSCIASLTIEIGFRWNYFYDRDNGLKLSVEGVPKDDGFVTVGAG